MCVGEALGEKAVCVLKKKERSLGRTVGLEIRILEKKVVSGCILPPAGILPVKCFGERQVQPEDPWENRQTLEFP